MSSANPPGATGPSIFRSIFAAYPDALLVVDAAGQIVLANTLAEQLLGYGVDELIGVSVEALVPDSIRPRHAAFRDGYGHAPRARPMGNQMDLVARRRDGSEVKVEIALSPLQDQGLPFVVASIRDIGQYPRVRQALLRARYSEHLAQVGRIAVDARDPQTLLRQATTLSVEALQVESAVVYLLEPDRNGFRTVGGAGLAPAHDVGTHVANRPDAFPGLLLARPGPALLGASGPAADIDLPPYLAATGLTTGLAVPLTDRGQTFGVLAVFSRHAHAFGEDEVRYLEALSSLLATSLQRAQTEEALNHAQRLESVGQLTGGIAHDFNNLLTVIQGNLQFLEETPALAGDDHGQRLLAAAARATVRASELTGKLLAFSRRQVLQPLPVDIAPLLLSLADMLRRTLDQRLHLAIDIGPDCPPVLADPVQLESAMLNVAINARDAMPDGGTLTFRIAVAAHAVPDVEPLDRAGQPRRFVAIAISDTGTGMPPEILERAFEPFFTTKGVGRGTGLGLSTVHGFVKQSHGSVTIASVPQVGTTVTLYLPTLDAPAHAATQEPSRPPMPPGLNVLLVEDDAAVRDVALAFLQGFGYRVRACSSGEEALPALEAGPPFDLLLTDIALGAGLRGTDLAARAQARQPGLAVLLVSGFSEELIDADRAAPLDWELLPKPYSRKDLERAISSAIAAHRPSPG
jgi:PAS domain S-box-containing protein